MIPDDVTKTDNVALEYSRLPLESKAPDGELEVDPLPNSPEYGGVYPSERDSLLVLSLIENPPTPNENWHEEPSLLYNNTIIPV